MLAVAITGILCGSVLNAALDERTPSCILALPSSASSVSACPFAKEPAPLHLERKDELPAGDPSPLPPFQSTGPQFFEDQQPAFFPARPSNLVSVLTSYPRAKELVQPDMPHSHGEPQRYEPVFGSAATAQSQSSGPVISGTGALTLTTSG